MGVILMTETYLLLKSFHILGVVIFLGNIIITGWWKVMADRTRHPKTVSFAQRQVTLTDILFTSSGVALILVSGLVSARLAGLDYLHVRWLTWGISLFILSGVIWALVLIPVQIKQARMARAFAENNAIPDSYWRLGRIWIIFGTIATILPLINLYWMVFKPL